MDATFFLNNILIPAVFGGFIGWIFVKVMWNMFH